MLRTRRVMVLASVCQRHYGVDGPQQQHRVGQRNVHQQPAVQNAVIARLLVELTLFFADALQVFHGRVQVRGQQPLQLLEHAFGGIAIGNRQPARAVALKKGSQLVVMEAAQLRTRVFVDVQAGRDRHPAHRSRAGCVRALLHAGVGEISGQGRAGLFHKVMRLIHELAAHAPDLLVDGLHGNALLGHARHVVLENGPEDAAQKDAEEDPHQPVRQPEAPAKTAVQQDQREAERAQPKMPAHPGLRAAHAPDRHLLARAQQPGKNHEEETDYAVRQPHRAAAARALRRPVAIRDVREHGHRENHDADEEPFPMGLVNPQRSHPPFHRCALGRRRALLQQVGEEHRRIDAVRSIVRTGIDATGLRVLGTEIAARSFQPGARYHAARLRGVVDLHRERMHINVAVWTIAGALAAADAPILDNDLHRVAAANGADRTTDHAQRIAATAAGGRDQELVEAQSVADQAAHAVVRIGAGAHALIASRAAIQIEHQQTLSLHQSLVQELLHRHILDLNHSLAVGLEVLVRHHLHLLADVGELIEHHPEIVAGDANHLDVIERSAGRHARAVQQERHLAEVAALGEIGQHNVAAGMLLRDLHEAQAHQVEAVGCIALLADDLSRQVADEFDALLEVGDEVRRERRQHGNALQVRIQRALLVGALQLLAEALVALHDVEHVAQHLEHGAVGFRAHSSRPRIVAHAGHLAEELALTELGDRLVHRQVDVGINRDGRAPVVLLGAKLAFVWSEEAPQLGEPSLRVVGGLDVRHGRREIDVDGAVENVEGRRAEFAFATDSLQNRCIRGAQAGAIGRSSWFRSRR